MAEFPIIREINTLERSFEVFDMNCLPEQLDISLELVRRNRVTEKHHLDVLKSVDQILRKLSRTHHPDKAINEKKFEKETACTQNLQVALNATRTVLKALTKAFLKDIDIHYRYEFFTQMDISSLINEKEMARQINNVLCKISFLSEVKRVNIVGEIRKFLQESQKCLRSFQDDDKDEFERHRDYALRYLHKCIEGYEVLAAECELIAKECRGEHGGSARNAIGKMFDRSRRELKILQKLERVVKKSIGGTFQIFSIDVPADSYDYYLVSPFEFYVNVLLMCNSVVNRKSLLRQKYESVKNIWFSDTNMSPQFRKKPELFLKAYHLASYFKNKTEYEREVEIILQRKSLAITNDNIIREFKDVVKSIADFLDNEFNIDTYKKGKSNWEIFTERLSGLNESLTGYKEVEKLQEKLNLCKKETNEIRKKCFEFSKKIQETEIQSRENILKCKSTSEEFAKLISGCNQKKGTRSRNFCQTKIYESLSCNDIKEESTEMKLEKLEQYEKINENFLEFLTDFRQNVSKFTGPHSSFSNQNEYFFVITGEVEKKMKAICGLNEKINEQLYYLITQTPSKIMEEIPKQVNIIEEDLEDRSSKKPNYANTAGESADIYSMKSFDLSDSERNITENANMISSASFNTYPFLKKYSDKLPENKQIEETVGTGRNGKLKGILDKKDYIKMVKCHFLLNEQDEKDKVKLHETKTISILNESNMKATKGMMDGKNKIEDTQSHVLIDKIPSESFSLKMFAEECTKGFQKENIKSVKKGDKDVKKDRRDKDIIEEFEDEDGKTEFSNQPLSNSHTTSPNNTNAEISSILVNTLKKIREEWDIYNTQFFNLHDSVQDAKENGKNIEIKGSPSFKNINIFTKHHDSLLKKQRIKESVYRNGNDEFQEILDQNNATKKDI